MTSSLSEPALQVQCWRTDSAKFHIGKFYLSKRVRFISYRKFSELKSYLKLANLSEGSDENTVSDIPAVAAYLQGSSLDWQFKTEPQPTACLGLVGKLKPQCQSMFILLTVLADKTLIDF